MRKAAALCLLVVRVAFSAPLCNTTKNYTATTHPKVEEARPKALEKRPAVFVVNVTLGDRIQRKLKSVATSEALRGH